MSRRPVNIEPLEPRTHLSAVVGRHVFYNHSAFDGRGGRADVRDDAAVAPDVVALLPGVTPSRANYTTYSRGLNGVMIDLDELPAGAVPTASDFELRVGNNGHSSGWVTAPAPRFVVARPSIGATPDQTVTRVTLTWRDRTIRNTWLKVSVLPTAATGLSAPDVFYFGNLPGEAGDEGAAAAQVTASDVGFARAGAGRQGAAIDDDLDFDRNGRVTRADARAARRNLGASLYTASPFEAAPTPGPGVSAPPLPGDWRLVFRDDFSAGALDPVWHTAQYWDHDLTVVGDGELEAYDPTGVSVSDGLLRLTARPDNVHGVPYVSGLIMAGGERAAPASPRFSFLYGYLEVRAKIPAGKGLWPAIWMMPASFNDDAGEIDVLEVFGHEPTRAQFAIHRQHRHEVDDAAVADLSQDFHTYAIDWQPDHVSWYVDGVELARTTDPVLICREAMYPILNLAVGGAAGSPDGTTVLPATMDVDYVRVWQAPP